MQLLYQRKTISNVHYIFHLILSTTSIFIQTLVTGLSTTCFEINFTLRITVRVQLLQRIKAVLYIIKARSRQQIVSSYLRAHPCNVEDRRGKTATVSTSAAIVTARLVAFVPGAGIADLASFSRSSQPPFPGWQDFTLCLPHRATTTTTPDNK